METWKKSEEAKFKFILKKKEIEFLEKLKADWKVKENEKNKIFKRHEAQLNDIEQRIKNKAKQLRSRERNLVILEEELKTRLVSISKELADKDDLLTQQKHKFMVEKKSLNK